MVQRSWIDGIPLPNAGGLDDVMATRRDAAAADSRIPAVRLAGGQGLMVVEGDAFDWRCFDPSAGGLLS